MKRTLLSLMLIMGIVRGVFAQAAGPVDLVVVLDTSTGMSSYHWETNDYLVGPFLREFLRIGDTFHLISFAETPRLELSRRMESAGDAEVIIARLLLMSPLGAAADLGAALNFAERHIAALPVARPRRVILVSDGAAPAAERLISASSARLQTMGAQLQFVRAPVAGNGPVSGRPIVTPSPAAIAQQPGAVTPPAAGVVAPPSAVAQQPGAVTPPAVVGGQPIAQQPGAVAPPVVGGQPPATGVVAPPPAVAQQQPGTVAPPPTAGVQPQAQQPGAGGTPPPAAGTQPQTQPGAGAPPPTAGVQSPVQQPPGTVTSPPTAGVQPQAQQPSVITPPPTAGSQPIAQQPSTLSPPPAVGGQQQTQQPGANTPLPTTGVQPEAQQPGTVALPPTTGVQPQAQQPGTVTSPPVAGGQPQAQQPGAVASPPAVGAQPQVRQSGTRGAGRLPLALLIPLAIMVLGALAFLAFFVARRLQNSPNRTMAQATKTPNAARMPNAAGMSREQSVAYSADAALLSSYAATQRSDAAGTSTSLQYPSQSRRPLPKDKVYVPTDGPMMLNLFVEDQSTVIGKRNIHMAKAGQVFSIGGGRSSDFQIFLVSVPQHIAEVVCHTRNCTFVPKKPKYFPDIGSQPVPDCIGKNIRLVSDKNYELYIRIEQYEDPLKALNKLLNSISVPGEVK